MTVVLAGTTGADPSTIYPEKYKNCFWNFVTGWQCELVEAAPPPPVYSPPPSGNTPDPNAQPATLPVLSDYASMPATDCGCCGGAAKAAAIAGGTVAPSGSGSTATAKKDCGNCSGCGYTNREILFAVGVALLFFLFVND